ncbi:MAG: L-histidine N(alpha)-methyltransferase [Nevskia sp.]
MLTKAAVPVAVAVPDKEARRHAPEAPRLARSEGGPRIVCQLRRADDQADADDAGFLAGLVASPAHSDPKFFYDAQGCALFDAICQLDEYYPTRTEAAIFAQHHGEIARQLPRAAQWIDLGAGDGAKARDWLPAVLARRYIGIDIAEAWLRPAVARIAEAHPRVEAIGVVADLTRPLAVHGLLEETPDSAAVFFYPGSSIGNFAPPRALELLQAIRSHCDLSGDGRGRLLIGIDLVKDRAVLEAAYDDALGVTAAFNLNLLRVANQRLGADFDARGFEHVARFDAEAGRIEMHLRARRDQTVRFTRPAPAQRDYAAGETIFTESSYKYTREQFAALLAQAGFGQHEFWTDPGAGFGVFLAAP